MMNQALLAASRLAADAGAAAFSAKDIVSTSVANAQTEMMGILGIVVPVVAGVTVAVVAVKFGMSWIKKIRG